MDRVHSATVRSVAPGGLGRARSGGDARWRTEAAPPETTITEPPKPAEAAAGDRFAADEASLFDCRLDGGEWAPCSDDPWVAPGAHRRLTRCVALPDGPHVFEVRAIDESGRVEPEPARWEFTLDRKAPTTRIKAGPVTTAEWQQPVFEFSSDEPGVHFECLRGDATYDEWHPCRSGEPVTGIFRSVEVRAVDAVGNADPSPAEWGNGTHGAQTRFRGEDLRTAPSVHRARGRAVTECSLDGEPFWRCPENFVEWDLRAGQHQMRVAFGALRRDAVSALPDSFTVKASVIPTASITAQPPARTTSRSARIAWVPTTATGSFVCTIDGAAQPCASPLQLSGLAVGKHRVVVSGRGPAGERNYYDAQVDWEVVAPGEAPAVEAPAFARAAAPAEAAPPRTTITPLPRPWISAGEVTLSFTADQAGSTFECMVDRGAWAPCASPLRLTGLTEADHEVQVRATNAGLTGAPDTEAFYVDRTAPDTRISSPMLVDGMLTSLPFARFVIEHRQLGTDEGHAWLRSLSWVRCVLDGVVLGLCPSRSDDVVFLDGLADGTHVLQAYALDEAGNVDPTPAVFTWVVGAPAVDTRIESGPPAATASRVAEFTLSATGADGFQCRLDGGAWEACRERGAPRGPGRRQPPVRGPRACLQPRRRHPCGVGLDDRRRAPGDDRRRPDPRSGDAQPAFTVLVDDVAARRECRLDGGAWGACPASVAVGDGPHVFEARAIDAGGRTGAADPWRWTTDLSAPDTTVTDAPPADQRAAPGAAHVHRHRDRGALRVQARHGRLAGLQPRNVADPEGRRAACGRRARAQRLRHPRPDAGRPALDGAIGWRRR